MESRYLFRGKRVDTGEWVEGSLVTGVFFRLGQEIPYMFCPNLADYDCFEDFSEENGIFEVDPSTICQCTGLKDKNGNLIWENDIIKAWSQGTCAKGKIKQRIDGTWIMYPAWQKGEMWYLCPDNNGETTVEVIGNVFDNPELLEV